MTLFQDGNTVSNNKLIFPVALNTMLYYYSFFGLHYIYNLFFHFFLYKGFTRKEYRAKLAIAITINYVRKYTREEAKVQEMGGLIQFGSPSFFKEMKDRFDIDLENVVYFKGETHYFVMTAKKQSLLKKGVLKSDKSNAVELLSRSNVDNIALLNYADEVAKFSTKYELPSLEYSVNHKGEPDVAMFDFSSMYYSENSSCIIDRHGKKLLLALIGDSLLEVSMKKLAYKVLLPPADTLVQFASRVEFL